MSDFECCVCQRHFALETIEFKAEISSQTIRHIKDDFSVFGCEALGLPHEMTPRGP